jgi:hypothetical protein
MTETSKINRRRFLKRLGLAGGSALLLGAADAAVVEPHWLRIRPVRIGTGAPVCRFAYFTDLHYKGDRAYVRSVVDAINGLSPDFVLFGGDLIEDGRHLPEALEHIAGITAPVYGVPGNHDYWSRVPFDPHRICFAATGGAWLMNETRLVADGRVNLIGLACNEARLAPLPLHPAAKNIVLMHYPAWANRIEPQGRRGAPALHRAVNRARLGGSIQPGPLSNPLRPAVREPRHRLVLSEYPLQLPPGGDRV